MPVNVMVDATVDAITVHETVNTTVNVTVDATTVHEMVNTKVNAPLSPFDDGAEHEHGGGCPQILPNFCPHNRPRMQDYFCRDIWPFLVHFLKKDETEAYRNASKSGKYKVVCICGSRISS